MQQLSNLLSKKIALQLRQVYFGGNWTAVNLKDTCNGITWKQATSAIYDCNTIATLIYHMTYYVEGVLKFLQGGPLETKDKLSFYHPPILSQEDWDNFLQDAWTTAEQFVTAVESVPDKQLEEIFVSDKHGDYYRNLQGIIEHMHYHLGQVVLLKKIINKRV